MVKTISNIAVVAILISVLTSSVFGYCYEETCDTEVEDNYETTSQDIKDAFSDLRDAYDDEKDAVKDYNKEHEKGKEKARALARLQAARYVLLGSIEKTSEKYVQLLSIENDLDIQIANTKIKKRIINE